MEQSFLHPEMDQKQQPNKKKRVITLASIVTLILALIALILFWPQSKKTNTLIKDDTRNPIVKKFFPRAATPLAFSEITIPSLRARSYQSSLGSRELISENDSYSSYLTNYTSDGLKINGLLTVPKGQEPKNGFPAIVFIHGYIPPTQYATLERYTDHIDYLARNGFVVFKIDLRGHGNSDGEPGGGYFGSDYVVDALHAYAALESSDFVNPKAIGMWGHSMAGNISLRSAAVKQDIPALVVWAGAVYSYTDLVKYSIDDNSYRPSGSDNQRQQRRRMLYEKYGSPSAQSVFWRQVAPTNYLNDFKGAIQLDHAVDDDVVNIGYSRDLTAVLDKTSVPHELHEYPSGGHNISGASFGQAMEQTVAFFTQYLSDN